MAVVRPLLPLKGALLNGIALDGAPFSWEVFGRAWLGNLWSVLVAVLVLASAWGWGWAVLRWMKKGGERPVTTMIGLGLGVLALTVMGSGLAGILFPTPVLAAALAGWAFLVAGGIRDARAGFPPGTGAYLRSRPALPWLLALGAMAVLCAGMGLGPEGGWDAVYYHLRLPKLYCLAHRIYFVPYLTPSHYPQNIEALYALGWLFGGEGPAKAVNLSFWFLAGCAVWRLASPLGARPALRATALALTMPIAGVLASENYVDLGLTFLGLAGLAEILAGRTAVAGVLLGFAMGAKYTAVAGFAAGAVVVLAGGSGGIRPLARLAVGALLPLLPWLVKNALFTGDPAAPFLSRYLSPLAWAGGISQEPLRAVHGLIPRTPGSALHSLATGLWGFLRNDMFGVFPPFVMGMFPALLWSGGTPRARALRVYTLAFTVIILVLAPDGRYWQPASFVLCVCIAAAWEGLGGRVAGPVLAGLAGLSTLLGVAYHFGIMNANLPGVFGVTLGLRTRDSYYARWRMPRGFWASVSRINSTVPPGERVAVISEVQAYLVDREAIFDSDAPGAKRWVDNLALACRSATDWERRFRRWNCRTVLYLPNRAAAVANPREWTVKETRLFADFWNSRARTSFLSGDCVVYTLAPRDKSALQLDLPAGQERWLVAMKSAEHSPDRCAGIYRAALASGAESGRLHQVFGGLMIDARRHKEAVAALRKSLAIAPFNADAWYWLAGTLMDGRRFREAREALEKAVGLNPGHDLRVPIERGLSAAGGVR